jgi:2-oxoglutarate ferredoxin oxidoreductase subunit gamma
MGSLEIRIAGFGGQGVILAGMVVGRAATIYDTKHVTLTQSFGPEARGSACSVQLIVSPEPVLNPYLTRPHLLVAMSQEAYTRFAPDLRPGGLLLYEEDLIELEPLRADITARGIPATRFAEELGRKLVLNMVMVGFVTGQTGIITPEAARKSVADSVPKGTEALNTSAFEKGLEYGLSLAGRPRVVAGKALDTGRFFEGTEDFVRS